MLAIHVVMLARVDVLLEQLRPRNVIDLRDVVAVELEGAEELVEAQARVSCDLCDADGRDRGLEGGGDDDAGDVVDGDHVDGVVDVGAGGELDAALDHADEEVVCVCCCGG